jgi:serine/threonine protein kinase/Flp pilus assembly protein TadD
MEDLTGRTLSHYTVVRKIGSGGMGVVYEAEDTSLGRRAALKFLPAELARDEQALERFRREARAASALNHPNICTVYAIESHEQQQFIAMELLEGQTLAEMLAGDPFPCERLLKLALQIADALESAHAKGIVHRDIKPANIFVNDRDQVKVLDFGLAKIDRAARGSESDPDAQTRQQDLTAIGTTLGTASYMSPEQARGQLADARTDLFSLGTVLYQMATGVMPFRGETTAVVYEAILNRTPPPLSQVMPGLPAELARIVDKALEKDRGLRYQTATDLKTDLIRLQRTLESGERTVHDSDAGRASPENGKLSPDSVAVLYFENLSGVKEDEYFRDGITEDIITELSKIRGLNVFSRHPVLAFRDKSATPVQIGQQLRAAYVLTGSLRRAGSRVRINAQLIDTQTEFPIWSERFDSELEDVFQIQDEIAQKIAGALQLTLTPQEQAEIKAKPTENLQAYDLYLRGKSYARRLTRQDLEFALQMFENAVAQDEKFALGYAAIANVCAQNYYHYLRETTWIGRAMAASQKAVALQPDQPEVLVAQAWILYASNQYEDAVQSVRRAIERKRDCEGAYYLLGRALFASGNYQELADIAEEALAASGNDYNVYVPIVNALGALGKDEALRNIRFRRIEAMEDHLKRVPEDARARTILSVDYATVGRVDDAQREVDLAMALRPTEATVLYNAACIYCMLKRKDDALGALEKAWDAGFKDADWARRDPDLALLHGHPEFERLYPEGGSG